MIFRVSLICAVTCTSLVDALCVKTYNYGNGKRKEKTLTCCFLTCLYTYDRPGRVDNRHWLTDLDCHGTTRLEFRHVGICAKALRGRGFQSNRPTRNQGDGKEVLLADEVSPSPIRRHSAHRRPCDVRFDDLYLVSFHSRVRGGCLSACVINPDCSTRKKKKKMIIISTTGEVTVIFSPLPFKSNWRKQRARSDDRSIVVAVASRM